MEERSSSAHDHAGDISFAFDALPVGTVTLLLVFVGNAIVYGGLRLGGAEAAVIGKRVEPFRWESKAVVALTQEMLTLGNILLFAWLCENYPLFEHNQKQHLPDFFWFICLGLLLFSLGSVIRDPKENEIVNRDQTEEWKGWMQTVFLLYHYFRAEEVYNSVRVMISCYVWMTGFGNFSFFYIKRDFGFARFAQMMWRLNFTVVFLCLLFNNMYMLYYICPLHTFYFVLVFVTMRVWHEINHTKWAIRLKLLVVGVLIYMVWEFGAVFDSVFMLLPTSLHPGAAVAAYGVKYEWHFRSGLDHFSTFYGMLFALNFPIATLWLKSVEELPNFAMLVAKGIVGSILAALTVWWVNSVLPLPKLEFNTMEPYTFFIPLLTYIYFRNITPYLRQVHLGVLATIGKYTLETYLLQHHVWLTSNAKTVLVLVPGYPKINLAVVTAVYFTLAQRIYRITMTTRGMLVPDDPVLAATYIGFGGAVLGICATSAWVLQFLGATWPLVISCACGLGFLALTFTRRQMAHQQSCESRSWNQAMLILFSGIAAVVLSTTVLPSTIPVGAPLNGGPLRPMSIKPTLQTCLRVLDVGEWKDFSDRVCIRDFAGARCSAQSWTWSDMDLAQECGLKEFCEKSGNLLVSGRTVAFVGDQTAYELFLATHRILEPTKSREVIPPVSLTADSVQNLSVSYPGDSSVAQGTLSFHGASTVQDLGPVLRTLLRAPQSAIQPSSPQLLVVALWAQDAQNGLSATSFSRGFADVGELLGSFSVSIVVTPPTVRDDIVLKQGLSKDTSEGYRQALLRSSQQLHVTKVLDFGGITARRSTGTDYGYIYDKETYAAPSQLVLNALQRILPATAKPAPVPGAKPELAKGKGGGVAEDPTRGLFALFVACIMLVAMDSYAGLAAIAWRLCGQPIVGKSITWEDAVGELHQRIFRERAPPRSLPRDDSDAQTLTEVVPLTAAAEDA